MPSAPDFEAPQGTPLHTVMLRAITESLAGNGVVANTDLEVTATATDLQISVATGDYFYIGQTYTLGAAETHTLSAGDGSNDRWDTVYFDTATQTTGVREGTAELNPTPPDIQGDEALLAVVYVPSGATDVPDSDVLNWRAKFSNEAEEVQYDDTTGVYGVNNVDAALNELQEAAQITAYPLTQTDLATGSVGTEQIIDGDVANADLTNPSLDVAAGTGITTTSTTISLGGSATLAVDTSVVDLEWVRGNDNVITSTLATLPEDGGAFGTLVDTSVTNAPVAGTAQTYGLALDATTLLQVYAEADGAGGIQNPAIPLSAALGLLAQSATPGYSTQGAAFYDTDDETPKYAESGGSYQRPLARVDTDQFDKDETGTVAAGNIGIIWFTNMADQETVEVYQAGLLLDTLEAAPSGLDLTIFTGDNAGNATTRQVVITGDGTVQDDETGDPLASWQNTTGGGITVALGVDNGNFNTGTGSSQDIATTFAGQIV